MEEGAKITVQMQQRTHEALKNLFFILKIDGATFDDRLFELATRAFAGRSAPLVPLRVRSKRGERKRRRQVEIKEETVEALRNMHGRMFPYLPWVSWDWFLNEVVKALEELLHEDRQELQVPRE